LFHFFLMAGRPMKAVPVLFLAVIGIAVLLGELVARIYSEPMNRWLRKHWGDGPEKLGSVKGTGEAALNENSVPV